jgi:hypothetical protein
MPSACRKSPPAGACHAAGACRSPQHCGPLTSADRRNNGSMEGSQSRRGRPSAVGSFDTPGKSPLGPESPTQHSNASLAWGKPARRATQKQSLSRLPPDLSKSQNSPGQKLGQQSANLGASKGLILRCGRRIARPRWPRRTVWRPRHRIEKEHRYMTKLMSKSELIQKIAEKHPGLAPVWWTVEGLRSGYLI